MRETDPLLRPSEARTILGITDKTLIRWANAGRLPSVRTPGGQRRYRQSQVERVSREHVLHEPWELTAARAQLAAGRRRP